MTDPMEPQSPPGGRWRGRTTAALIVGLVATTAVILNWPYRYSRWYLLDHGAVTPAPHDGSLNLVRGGFPITYLSRYYPPDTFAGRAAASEPVIAPEGRVVAGGGGSAGGPGGSEGGSDPPGGDSFGGDSFGGDSPEENRSLRSANHGEVPWVREEWRPLGLGCNLLFWLALAGMGGWAVLHRPDAEAVAEGAETGDASPPDRIPGLPAGATPRPGRFQRRAAAAAAAVVSGIPMGVVGFQAWTRHRESTAQRASGVVLVGRCVSVPAVIGSNLPRGWLRLLERVESFQLRRERSVDRTLARFGGVLKLTLSPRQLLDAVDVGLDTTGVHQLTLLSGRIDAEVASILDANPQLTNLTMVDCDIDGDGWEAVRRLPNLRRLQIPRSRVKTAEPLAGLASRQTIRELLVSVTPDGPGWTFDSFPGLRTVQLDAAAFGRQMPPVTFKDLSQMTLVMADPRSAYDLSFVRCSNFRSVRPAVYGSGNGSRSVTGATVRITRLRLQDCDAIDDWTVSLGETADFDVRDCDGLHALTAGAMVTGQLGSVNLVDVDGERVERLLQTIFRCRRLRRLTLYGIPMDAHRLARLAELPELERLTFQRCEVSFKALLKLRDAPSLRGFRLDYMPGLTMDRLREITSGWNRLEELAIDLRDIDRLDWRPPATMRSIQTGPLLNPRTIRLKGIDELETSLHVIGSPDSFELGDASRMTGLAMQQPLPPSSTVGRLRDLRYICVGGSAVNEDWFDRLILCPDLERVVLAYPDIPAERLRDLAWMSNLRSLSIPGWDADDRDFEAIAARTSFWSLNLSDTRIDAALIPWLSRCEGLRYLALDRVPLSAEVRRRLSNLRQITHLSLRGVPMSAEDFGELLRSGRLEYLDCSDTTLTAEHLDRLAAVDTPRTLIAQNVAEVTPSDWVDLLHRRPKLQIDVGEAAEDVVREASRRSVDFLSARVRDDLVRHSLHHVRREVQIAAFLRSLTPNETDRRHSKLEWAFTGDDIYVGDVRPFRDSATSPRTVASVPVD